MNIFDELVSRGLVKLIIFLGLFFLGGNIWANPEYRAHVFSSEKMQIFKSDETLRINEQVPGRYPWFVRWFLGEVISWEPGIFGRGFAKSCASDEWYDRLESLSHSQARAEFVQKILSDCPNLQSGPRTEILNYKGKLSIAGHPLFHPYTSRVLFHLPGNIKLGGLLAFRGDLQKRPMLIVRMGVFGSVEDFAAERFLFYQLFEQGYFNVLFVENLSSADFLFRNENVSIGGYEEGLQNLWLAKLLQDPQEHIHQIVSSVHLFGMSLGGHGVLYANLHNPQGFGRISSFTAFCPLVDFKSSFGKLTETSLRNSIINFWVRKRVDFLLQKWNVQTDWWQLLNPQKYSLRLVMDHLSDSFKGPLGGAEMDAAGSSNFLNANNFLMGENQFNSPLLVLATQKDPLVPYELNAQKLTKKSLNLTENPKGQLGVVSFSEGYHCTLPIAYDWKSMTELSFSQVFAESKMSQLLQLKQIAKLDNCQLSQYEIQNVQWAAGQIQYTINLNCAQGRERLTQKIGLLQLELGIQAPISLQENKMIRRWLTQNLKFKQMNQEGKTSLVIYLRARG